jgi:hypothetical protein
MTNETEVDSDKIVISCAEINPKYGQFLVETTISTITTILSHICLFSRQINNLVFGSAYGCITNYSAEQLVKFAETQDKETFKNWCNDVVLFYALRFYLSEGKLRIPVMKGEIPKSLIVGCRVKEMT